MYIGEVNLVEDRKVGLEEQVGVLFFDIGIYVIKFYIFGCEYISNFDFYIVNIYIGIQIIILFRNLFFEGQVRIMYEYLILVF